MFRVCFSQAHTEIELYKSEDQYKKKSIEILSTFIVVFFVFVFFDKVSALF